MGRLTLGSFCQLASLERVGESEGEAQEVFCKSLHKDGCGFFVLGFWVFLFCFW